jgi:lysyl-tRNA synthetase class 2
LEVETPLRIPSPAPERHIDPEPSGNRFLITSPELQMKRLVAAGYERVFQICRCFRRGERGSRHLPEYTMLEWYRTGARLDALMADCEALLVGAREAVGDSPPGNALEAGVDFAPPFERMEVQEAFSRFAGWRPGALPDPHRFDRDLVDKVEPALPGKRPVFLVGYPRSMASLARIDPADDERAERVELYAGGLELANGFCELTCAVEQRERFERESAERAAAGKTVAPLDEYFLEALAQGLPEAAGMALGIDRLVMLLTGAREIDEVVAFPEGTF